MASLAERVRVYLVADFGGRAPEAVYDAVAAALEAGLGAVQYRDKAVADPAAQRGRAERLAGLCRDAGALFFVNDHLDLARAVGADGVHLGPHDLDLAQARAQVGRALLLGGSAGTPERALALAEAGADYLGVGAIYDAAGTKADASAPRGPEALIAVRCAVPGVPLVAIGGITEATAAAVCRAGADGVAVSRALLDAPDPAAATRALARAVRDGLAARPAFG
jgi:thiamine-phosphate pyrophosphorylase